jgi:hypothetical protein
VEDDAVASAANMGHPPAPAPYGEGERVLDTSHRDKQLQAEVGEGNNSVAVKWSKFVNHGRRHFEGAILMTFDTLSKAEVYPIIAIFVKRYCLASEIRLLKLGQRRLLAT